MLWLATMMVGLGGQAAVGTLGTIEGRLRYPACTEIPADLVVCGEEAQNGVRVCGRPYATVDGYRYRLQVPAGQYRVFAQTESARPGYRAYYSASVVCGLRVDCKDHAPILITAVAGQIQSGVEPADWFDPGTSKQGPHLASNF
jgi:hypothetical protein